MTIHLFTTSDLKQPRWDDLERLLASVAASSRDLAIRHHLLLQNCDEAGLARLRARAPGCCRLTALPGRVSLSEARNRLLAAAWDEGPPAADDVVGFPDDDCWLPEGWLAEVDRLFTSHERLDVLVCRVSLDPVAPDAAPPLRPAAARDVVRMASSNSMFLRAPLVREIGPFDPELGLGTAAGGGEDTDYVIRAYLAGRETGFIDSPLVGHPPPSRDTAAKYYRGAFLVLARHARRQAALRREFLRKILVGLYFAGRGKLSLRDYGAALREGATAWRAGSAAFAAGGRP
ncbi:MAG: glycosyltransferase family 2 protein [Methylobacteriaceae bacterium]|nr:glycosyltransferase family 2 protein [Methylobacteriaceae bacterium]